MFNINNFANVSRILSLTSFQSKFIETSVISKLAAWAFLEAAVFLPPFFKRFHTYIYYLIKLLFVLKTRQISIRCRLSLTFACGWRSLSLELALFFSKKFANSTIKNVNILSVFKYFMRVSVGNFSLITRFSSPSSNCMPLISMFTISSIVSILSSFIWL